VPAFRNEDVRRLYVPMNDPRRVRRIERVGDLHRQLQQRIDLHGTSRDAVLQHHAVQILHGDEGFPIFLANVVDGADIRVVERRCRFGLAPKSLQRLRISGQYFGQEFERDESLQARVLRLVHHPHAAAAELFYDAVVRDRPPDHRRECYVTEKGKSMKAAQFGSDVRCTYKQNAQT